VKSDTISQGVSDSRKQRIQMDAEGRWRQRRRQLMTDEQPQGPDHDRGGSDALAASYVGLGRAREARLWRWLLWRVFAAFIPASRAEPRVRSWLRRRSCLVGRHAVRLLYRVICMTSRVLLDDLCIQFSSVPLLSFALCSYPALRCIYLKPPARQAVAVCAYVYRI